MKTRYLILLFLFATSCISPDNNLLEINPEKLNDNGITLSEIADDITYIPLDNNYPMCIFFKIKVLKNTIYLSERNNGVIALNKEGKLIRKYGSRGRGPGEYTYGMAFTVAEDNGTIYVLDNNQILKYSKNGVFLGNISLEKYGASFKDLEFYNSKLLVFEYISFGTAKYNWIVLDSTGNLESQKNNPVLPFDNHDGLGGGISKHGDRLLYWNKINDTIYSISKDLSSMASFLFNFGDNKMPKHDIELSQGPDYIFPLLLIETNKYVMFYYSHKLLFTIGVIEKENRKSYKTIWKGNFGGFKNDLDGGVSFEPKYYFEEEGREYMVGYTQPLNIKARVNSTDFKSYVPGLPAKKEALIKQADSMKDTDNALLTIVRLKN